MNDEEKDLQVGDLVHVDSPLVRISQLLGCGTGPRFPEVEVIPLEGVYHLSQCPACGGRLAELAHHPLVDGVQAVAVDHYRRAHPDLEVPRVHAEGGVN